MDNIEPTRLPGAMQRGLQLNISVIGHKAIEFSRGVQSVVLARTTRISACNVARDQNSPTTAHQINLQRSIIAATINRFAGERQLFLVCRFAVGTASLIGLVSERLGGGF